MASTWMHWLGRLAKIAVITPSTFVLLFIFLVSTGGAVMAEPGHYHPPVSERVSGLLILAGLVAIWTSILSGSGARFSHRTRLLLFAGLFAGVVGGMMALKPNSVSEFDVIFAAQIPMFVMSVVESVRLLKPRP